MTLAYSTLERNPVVEAYLGTACGGSQDLVLDIHPDDNMFAFLADDVFSHREAALLSYFRSGWSAAQTILALRDAAGGAGRAARILDFAGGYGRTTRFLARAHDPSLITVCDILEDAVQFQEQSLGVGGYRSASVPEQLELPGGYDLIFVGSLFSHLPEGSFTRWLTRLVGLLAPGGLLAFTTHDQSLLLPGREMPASGIHFEPQSDLDDRLDLEEYGTAWVSAAFVEAAIAAAGPGPLASRWIPRGAWSFQDLWLVSTASGSLASIDVGIEAQTFIEEVRRVSADTIEVAGWVADMQAPARLPSLELQMDGVAVASTLPTGRRADVAEMLHLDPDTRVGFVVRWTSPKPLDPRQLVGLVSVTEPGVRYVGHLDTIASSELLAAVRLRQRNLDHNSSSMARLQLDMNETVGVMRGLQARVADLDFVLSSREYELAVARADLDASSARIRAMEASRFWRIRNAWFAVRRRLGIAETVDAG